MERVEATAWRADWLNAWLAAVGVACRLPAVTLSWTDDVDPAAVFYTPSVAYLERALPSKAEVEALVIAPRRGHAVWEFPRKPSLDQFQKRAGLARQTGDWSLGSTVSDLLPPKQKELPHSRFDPPAPKGVTLHERLASLNESHDVAAPVIESMLGRLQPVVKNGLGFDLRRLAASCVPGENLLVDPAVEILSFFGLLLFHQNGQETRGWKNASMFEPGAFSWPTWSEPLDWVAIDAVMDMFYADAAGSVVGRSYESVAYAPTASADVTRGIGSRPRLAT